MFAFQNNQKIKKEEASPKETDISNFLENRKIFEKLLISMVFKLILWISSLSKLP